MVCILIYYPSQGYLHLFVHNQKVDNPCTLLNIICRILTLVTHALLKRQESISYSSTSFLFVKLTVVTLTRKVKRVLFSVLSLYIRYPQEVGNLFLENYISRSDRSTRTMMCPEVRTQNYDFNGRMLRIKSKLKHKTFTSEYLGTLYMIFGISSTFLEGGGGGNDPFLRYIGICVLEILIKMSIYHMFLQKKCDYICSYGFSLCRKKCLGFYLFEYLGS